MKELNETIDMRNLNNDLKESSIEILKDVIKILNENGYKGEEQIVGYLMTGDPSYIPRIKECRNIIKKMDREYLLKLILENLK